MNEWRKDSIYVYFFERDQRNFFKSSFYNHRLNGFRGITGHTHLLLSKNRYVRKRGSYKYTVGSMKTVLSVYAFLVITIYLFYCRQVDKRNVYMEHPVY